MVETDETMPELPEEMSTARTLRSIGPAFAVTAARARRAQKILSA
jgi:hypothetical protein